jgi:hypothetical protein
MRENEELFGVLGNIPFFQMESSRLMKLFEKHVLMLPFGNTLGTWGTSMGTHENMKRTQKKTKEFNPHTTTTTTPTPHIHHPPLRFIECILIVK